MIKLNIVPAFRKLTHILTLAVLLRAPLTNASWWMDTQTILASADGYLSNNRYTGTMKMNRQYPIRAVGGNVQVQIMAASIGN